MLRPELKACHAFLDVGDTLVVPSLDRYRRSLQDLINMVAELRERGIGFTSLHENLDPTAPGGLFYLMCRAECHRRVDTGPKRQDLYAWGKALKVLSIAGDGRRHGGVVAYEVLMWRVLLIGVFQGRWHKRGSR